jgi:hypothetical protein
MTNTNLITMARRIVLGMSCGVALLSVVVFVVLFVFGGDTLLEATVQVAPLAASALLGICGPVMERRWRAR